MKADKKKAAQLVKTARGQLDGILKMMEDDRYCVDISNQLMATQAILRRVNRDIIKAHLDGCVREAFEHGGGEEKIAEIMHIIDKLDK